MHKGSKKSSTPLPETFWHLGRDSFRKLAWNFHYMSISRDDDKYVNWHCDKVAQELINKVERAPVGQWQIAVRAILVGMLTWAPRCEEPAEHKEKDAPKRSYDPRSYEDDDLPSPEAFDPMETLVSKRVRAAGVRPLGR